MRAQQASCTVPECHCHGYASLRAIKVPTVPLPLFESAGPLLSDRVSLCFERLDTGLVSSACMSACDVPLMSLLRGAPKKNAQGEAVDRKA